MHDVLGSLSPEARDVMECQGRHVSNRMAAERQRRQDMKEARDDIQDEWVRRRYHAGPSFAELQEHRYGREFRPAPTPTGPTVA